MTAMEPDHDTAQALVFLGVLRAEIQILARRIEDAYTRVQQA